MEKLNLNLKRPCNECPFRKDTMFGWLGKRKATEIIDCIAGSDHGSFSCHKTNDFTESGVKETETTEHCAGALILLHKLGSPNMAMRLGYLARKFNGKNLLDQDQVFDRSEDFIRHHAGIAPRKIKGEKKLRNNHNLKANQNFENQDTILRTWVAQINEQRAVLFKLHLKNEFTPIELQNMKKANSLLGQAAAVLKFDPDQK